MQSLHLSADVTNAQAGQAQADDCQIAPDTRRGIGHAIRTACMA